MSESYGMAGKRVLITGGSGGIGGATARLLAERGSKLILVDRDEAALAAFAEELRAGGAEVLAIVADVTVEDDVKRYVAEAVAEFGGIDGFFNNAGIEGKITPALELDYADWNKVIAVNLTAAFKLSRAVLMGMMRRRHGRIISISSVVAVTGNAGQGNYAASKAGLIGMTKALAQEVASRGVTANCIAPGFVGSAMTDALNDKQKDAVLSRVPMKRLGTVVEIAAAAVYLASDEAAYTTGQTMHVNGGMAMI